MGPVRDQGRLKSFVILGAARAVDSERPSNTIRILQLIVTVVPVITSSALVISYIIRWLRLLPCMSVLFSFEAVGEGIVLCDWTLRDTL